MMTFSQICLFAVLSGAAAIAADRSPALLESEVELDSRPLISAALDLQYAPVQYKNYDWSGGRQTGKNGHGIHMAVEMLPFEDTYGKVGFGLGTGFYAIANARFDNRLATLAAIPFEGFVSYRFDYLDDQTLVPFVKLGMNATLARQRGFGEGKGWQTYYGWDMSGGLQLCLNRIDPISVRGLRRSTGIDNSYLTVEYLRSRPVGRGDARPNLSREELRAGFRFEM